MGLFDVILMQRIHESPVDDSVMIWISLAAGARIITAIKPDCFHPVFVILYYSNSSFRYVHILFVVHVAGHCLWRRGRG